jgi:hypothetical protein
MIAMNKKMRDFIGSPVTMTIGILMLAWICFWILYPRMPKLSSGTSEPPNLYELTRQTAENTRWIFWVLVVGVVELGCLSSFLMFKKR